MIKCRNIYFSEFCETLTAMDIGWSSSSFSRITFISYKQVVPAAMMTPARARACPLTLVYYRRIISLHQWPIDNESFLLPKSEHLLDSGQQLAGVRDRRWTDRHCLCVVLAQPLRRPVRTVLPHVLPNQIGQIQGVCNPRKHTEQILGDSDSPDFGATS